LADARDGNEIGSGERSRAEERLFAGWLLTDN
jgi:hypothetical protein